MGAAPSSGQNNDELVDGLIDNGYIHYRSMEFAFRIVDRGDFFPDDKRTENAYKDQAWRSEDGNPGFIHLSAPCIYANALEYLDLRPGLSFLNIGSGSGYFNTVAGYLLTETGTNHGVELFENMIEYADSAQQKHSTRPSSSAFSFCEPEFFNASAFYIKNGMQYDRIYVGALVPNNRRVYFCQMLKIGGILVLPYGSRLLQIVRKDVDKYFIYKISNVSFSSLIDPTPEVPRTKKMVELPRFNARPLAELCRTTIRAHLRRNVFATHPIQMQFEIGLTKEVDEQPDEENQMERIGTFYFANRRNRQAAEEERAQENPEAREEQNAEANEDLFERADPVNAANETPEAIRNLLRTPPMDEQPNVNQENEENAEGENEQHQNNFEVWSPEREGQQNNDPMPEQDEHELEDGMDAERAAMIEAENQNEQHQEPDPQPDPVDERHQPLPPPNIAIAPNPRFQIRRQRLHVNLINGNRLVGFLNQGDDEDEDLFREAEERNAPTEPVGLAVYDKSTSAVFHTTDVRPTLDHIDMKQILPNYEPPKPKSTKGQSNGEDDLHRDAGTVTEDIRSRRTRFDVRIAMRPTRNDNPHQRLVLRHANYGGQVRLNQQPSTSMADQQPHAQEVGTQTDVDANLPNNPPTPQRMAPIEAVHHIFHGLHQGIDALHRRQQLGQLRDRLRRFHPIPSHTSQVSATSTTGANAASSVSSNATTSSASINRAGIKRKIDEDTKSEDADILMKGDEESTTSMPKMSRSASLPDCSQEEPSTSEIMSNFLYPNRQMQSQSSSLRPVSPVLSNSSAATVDPSSPSSVATTVSSEASSAQTGNTASTSSQASGALSDVTSGDVSSLAGGSTSSAAQTASTMETSSGFGSDDQQQQSNEEKQNEERAERTRTYHRQLESFHEEFQRRLKLLPLSERLIRFVCYEN